MRVLHFPTTEMVCPSFLTDDWGNELQVLPFENARNKISEGVIVNEQSWLRLLNVERPFE